MKTTTRTPVSAVKSAGASGFREWSIPEIQEDRRRQERWEDSVLTRNEALAKELGKVREINRKLRERLNEMRLLQLFLVQPKEMSDKLTQTESVDRYESEFEAPAAFFFHAPHTPPMNKNSPVLLLSRLSKSKKLVKSFFDLENLEPQQRNRSTQEVQLRQDVAALKNDFLIDKCPAVPEAKVCSSEEQETHTTSLLQHPQRKSTRVLPSSVESYQEPSLRIKIRKGFKFFERDSLQLQKKG